MVNGSLNRGGERSGQNNATQVDTFFFFLRQQTESEEQIKTQRLRSGFLIQHSAKMRNGSSGTEAYFISENKDAIKVNHWHNSIVNPEWKFQSSYLKAAQL